MIAHPACAAWLMSPARGLFERFKHPLYWSDMYLKRSLLARHILEREPRITHGDRNPH